MRRIGRARVHHPAADHVRVRPLERQRRRVVRTHPDHPRGLPFPNLHARIVAGVSSEPFGLVLFEVVFAGRAEHLCPRTRSRHGDRRAESLLSTDAVLVELLVAGPLRRRRALDPQSRRRSWRSTPSPCPCRSGWPATCSARFSTWWACSRWPWARCSRWPSPACAPPRGPAAPRAGRARMEATRARDELRGDAERDRRRRDRPGAGRQPVYANDAALELLGYATLRRASGGAARGDSSPATSSSTSPATSSRSSGCPAAGRSWARGRAKRSSASASSPPARSAGRREGHPGRGRQRRLPAYGDQRDGGHDGAQAQRRWRERFLSDCSRSWLLAGPGRAARGVARLAVPEVADWCTVDLLAPDGEVARVALEHADPDLLGRAREVEPALSRPRSGQSTGPASHRTGKLRLSRGGARRR